MGPETLFAFARPAPQTTDSPGTYLMAAQSGPRMTEQQAASSSAAR